MMNNKFIFVFLIFLKFENHSTFKIPRLPPPKEYIPTLINFRPNNEIIALIQKN